MKVVVTHGLNGSLIKDESGKASILQIHTTSGRNDDSIETGVEEGEIEVDIDSSIIRSEVDVVHERQENVFVRGIEGDSSGTRKVDVVLCTNGRTVLIDVGEEVIHTEGRGEGVVQCHVGQLKGSQTGSQIDDHGEGHLSCCEGLYHDQQIDPPSGNDVAQIGDSQGRLLEIRIDDGRGIDNCGVLGGGCARAEDKSNPSSFEVGAGDPDRGRGSAFGLSEKT
jgi:hypothetical protein